MFSKKEEIKSIGNPVGIGKGTGFGLWERDRDGIGLGHYRLRASFIVVRVSCEGSFLAYAWYNYYNTLKARPVQREIGPQTQFVWRSFVISGHKTIFQKPATALGYHLSIAVHPF